jgi:hypothetical protein
MESVQMLLLSGGWSPWWNTGEREVMKDACWRMMGGFHSMQQINGVVQVCDL